MRHLTLAMAIAALLLIGCQQAAEKAVEQATGVQVNQEGKSVTVKGKDGEAVTIASGLPQALVSFPVPPGFKVDGNSGGSVAAGGESMAVGMWSGAGNIQAVSDFYKKTMVDQGWKQEFVQEAGDMVQQSYTKGDGQAVLIITRDGESVQIQAMLGNKPK